MTKRKIALLYGGRSGEHEVSLRSAASVYQNLNRNLYEIILIGVTRHGLWYRQSLPEEKEIVSLRVEPEADSRITIAPGDGIRENGRPLAVDLIFPVIHGTFGEDGTLQGLLEMAGIPYAGAGVLGSALGMDKEVIKRLWREAGLPVVPFTTLSRSQLPSSEEGWADLLRKTQSAVAFPCFVKPARGGSSVGISRADNAEEMKKALREAFRFDTKVLLEPALNAREIECSVVGNERPEAFVLGEIEPQHAFYSYEAKYLDPDGAALIIPAPLPAEEAERLRTIAVEAYRCAAMRGMARVDFFLDRDSGGVFLNEINTIPGFTSISMFSMLCEKGGLPYPELLDRLINLGLEHAETLKQISFGLS